MSKTVEQLQQIAGYGFHYVHSFPNQQAYQILVREGNVPLIVVRKFLQYLRDGIFWWHF